MKGITIILSSLLAIASGYSVFEDVKQYCQCSNLTMIENEVGTTWSYWTPDPSVENNQLDDSFYAENGFSGDNFDENMRIMYQIKNQLKGCDSDFCRCAKKGPNNQWGSDYTVYFQDNTFEDVKTIIKDLDSALSDSIVPYDELKNYWGYGGYEGVPTLTNFSLVTEYGNIRYNRYSNFWSCLTWNNTEYMTCYTEARVDYDNREVLFYGDKRGSKKQLVCNLFSFKNCPVEQTRFYAMSLWADPYFNFNFCDDENLIDVMDGLIDSAKNYDFSNAVDSVYMSIWMGTVYYKAYKTNWGQTTLDAIGSSFECISSDEFSIFCETSVSSDNNTIISGITITTTDGTSFIIDKCKFNDIQNETIKNSWGENVFEIVVYSYPGSDYKYFEIYDFNSRSIIGVNKNYISVSTPIRLFEKSTGFLVDGPNDGSSTSSPSGSVKTAGNKMACKNVCESMSKTIEKFTPFKNLNSQKSFDRCTQDC